MSTYKQPSPPRLAAASPAAQLISGGGEMGALIRATDWAPTPLGPIETWPQSLRTSVSLMLNSRYPMFVWWGRALTNLYNDAYIPVLGARHPHALGQSAPDIWADIWSVVGPQAELVLNEGRATWNESGLLVMERYGYAEETYFTFSYSPVPDDAGGVGGVFCACTEDTGRVIGERRLRLLKALAETSVSAETDSQACERASRALAEAGADLPFALLYLASPDGRQARLAGSAGLTPGQPASPLTVTLADADSPWPLARVAATSQPVLLEDLRPHYPNLPGGPWPEPARAAMVLPISAAGQERPTGYLVAGLSPRRAFDDDYRAFLQLVAGHIASAITDARALEAERQRAEALAEIDRAKTAFFSNVSHEFRTPLTLLLGVLEAALAAPAGEPAQPAALAMAHRNAVRLLKMVNALLDFARLEAGRVQAAYVPTDLAALTAELASMFRAAIERAELRLVVDCPPLPEPVYVDRELWEKIVLNLLSNALKFTRAGEISVRLAWTGTGAALRVCDTGVGIAPEDQANLFTRFHRIRGVYARTHEGTGIGLALVQELARLHGGAVSVESAPGQGSCFTVHLPAGAAHLPPDRLGQAEAAPTPTPASSAYLLEAFGWLPGDPKLEAAPEDAWEASPGFVPTPAARLLVADDNADMRAYLGRLLGQHWQVELVADGQAALDRARAHPPDLVLSDVMMPGLDGFELLRALRADPATRTVPVVLLSARAGEEARVEGLGAGADDYLVKPFSARELVARLDAQLSMAQQRRALLEQVQSQANQLRLIADSLPALIAYVDAEHRYRFNNRGYADWFGHDPAALNGQHLRDALGAEAYAALRPHIEAALNGQPVTFEAEVPYAHGGRRPIRAMYVPHTDAQGRTLGFYSLVTDMTERQAAEEAVRRSEEKYRSLFNSIDEGFCLCELLVDAAGRPRDYLFLEVNPTFEQHTGLRNAPGKTALELVPNLERAWIESYGRVALTGEPARFVQGSEAMGGRWFDVYAFRIGAPAERRFALLFSDITARKQASEKLRRTQARLESALKAGLAGTFYWDWRTSRIITDENMMRYFSLSAEALEEGAPLSDILPAVHPDDRPQVEAALTEALEHTGVYQSEYRVHHSDGRLRWLSARGLAERDATGQRVGLAGFAVDVTERKLAEEERAQYARRLEERVAARTAALNATNEALRLEIAHRRRASEELEQSQDELRRLSAYLQQVREHERTWMAREIHDELGQQLTGLKMDVAALRKRLDPELAREALGDLTGAIDSAIQTVRRLASELRPSILDDFGLIAAMEAHLSEFQRRAGIKARLSATADETRLTADVRTALFRILQEALTNIARHAEATAVSVVLEEADSHLTLEIRDNGRGIADEALSGSGSLGLLGMRERARLLDGELSISGTPGAGTVVRVTVAHPQAASAT